MVGTVEIDVPPIPESSQSKEDASELDEKDDSGDLRPATLSSILAQAGLTPEELDRIGDEVL